MFEGSTDEALASDVIAIKKTDNEAKVDGGLQENDAKKQAKILELLDAIKNRANTEELVKIIQALEKQKEKPNSDLNKAEIEQIIATAKTEVSNDYLTKINDAEEVYQLLSLRKTTTLSQNQQFLDQARAGELELAIADRLKTVQDAKSEAYLKKLTEIAKTQSELEKFMREVDASESNELINPDGAENVRTAIRTEITNAYLKNINEAEEVSQLFSLRKATTMSENQKFIDQSKTGELESAIADRLKTVQDKKAEELLAQLADIDKSQEKLATFMKVVDRAESNQLVNPDGAEKVKVAIRTEITNAYLKNINEAEEVHTLLYLGKETTLRENQKFIDQTRTGELESAIKDKLIAVQDKKAEDLLNKLSEINKTQNELEILMKEVDASESNGLIKPEGAEKVRAMIRTEISKLI